MEMSGSTAPEHRTNLNRVIAYCENVVDCRRVGTSIASKFSFHDQTTVSNHLFSILARLLMLRSAIKRATIASDTERGLQKMLVQTQRT
jgi:hypothetical protein